MTNDLQARLRGFGYRPCPFDDPKHFQEVDDPCLVCGGLGTDGEPDKCVGNIDLLHTEAADEIARLTDTVERLEGIIMALGKQDKKNHGERMTAISILTDGFAAFQKNADALVKAVETERAILAASNNVTAQNVAVALRAALTDYRGSGNKSTEAQRQGGK